MAVRKTFTHPSRRTSIVRLLPLALLAMQVALCGGQTPAGAADPNAVDTASGLAINFQDVPLQTVLEYLSEKAGLVVVTETPLTGRVTVISRKPIAVDAIIALINSTLKDKDLAAVRAGNTLRVVSLAKAKTMNLPVTSGSDPDEIAAGDDIVTHVIPISHADVSSLRENLASLLPEYASMEANQEGNALIVTDTTANIKRYMEIVRALDTQMAMVAEIKVFHLNLADATTTAELINTIFEQDTQQSSNRNQARGGPEAFFQMMGGGPGGRGGRRGDDNESSSSGARANARVVASADQRTNSVVVRGPAELLAVIEEMVIALDSRSAAVADVKVFHLEYADADNAAQLVNEVFGAQGSSSSSRSRSSRSNNQMPVAFRGGPFGQGPGGGDTSEASSSMIAVVAAADERTNSVVVSGPADTLVVVGQIMKELDANPEQERQIFVYALKNADAANLREILNNLFTEMQSLNQQGGGSSTQRFQGGPGGGGQATATSSSSSDLSDEAYFEADEATNSLLVMTSSKNYKMIEPIIEKLDRRLGQVLIKVLFAEVTYNDSLDLGLEFSFLNDHAFGESETYSTTFPPTQAAGMLVHAIAGDLDVTLRALQEEGRLNILSRPYILTSDNQTATITVGEERPFITNSRETNEGQTINTITYQDVGIVLEVTPTINPEGLVTMDVAPEISTVVENETVPISETVNAPVYAKRSSQTRVTIRDGQTIVIGGLVKDEVSEGVNKVPVLGDLPVVGGLFKRTQNEKRKTELLIFLTPHVATGDEDLEVISEAHSHSDNIENDKAGAELFREHMENMIQSDLQKIKPPIKPPVKPNEP